MPVGRRQRAQQLDTSGDHLVVVWNQASDLDVVAISVNVKMTLDRVRLGTGHETSLQPPAYQVRDRRADSAGR